MITIHTTRYSKVVAAFVARYPDAVAHLDKRVAESGSSTWCTNAALLGVINFSLRRGKTELLGFHDGPSNMWASSEALPLVEELAAQKLLRFNIAAPPRSSLLSRLFGRGNDAQPSFKPGRGSIQALGPMQALPPAASEFATFLRDHGFRLVANVDDKRISYAVFESATLLLAFTNEAFDGENIVVAPSGSPITTESLTSRTKGWQLIGSLCPEFWSRLHKARYAIPYPHKLDRAEHVALVNDALRRFMNSRAASR